MVATTDIAREVVGIIGNIIAFFLFLSPVSTFITICKKRSVEQYSPVPYLATFVNCMVWVLYGLPMVHPHSLLVVTINGTGVFIELAYLTLFAAFSDGRKRVQVILIALVEVIFVAILTVLVLILAHTCKERTLIVGVICMGCNIMMYASPLSVMKLVIKTKSVEYMPFYLSLASFANGASWTAYALIRFDLFIALPNGLGTLFSVAQLILYATFYKSTKRQMAARGKGDVGLAELGVTGDSNKIRNAPQNGHLSEINGK